MFLREESPRRSERRRDRRLHLSEEGDQDNDGNAFEIFDDENSDM